MDQDSAFAAGPPGQGRDRSRPGLAAVSATSASLGALVRATRLPVWRMDLVTTEISEISGPAAELLGGRPDQLIHRRAVALLVDQAGFHSRLRLLASGELDSYQVRGRAIRRLDGQELIADACVTAVPDEIPRRNAIAVLLPADASWTPLTIGPHPADQTALGTVDGNWRIDRISADIRDLIGYEAADLVGESLASVVRPGDWPGLLIAVGHSLREDTGTTTRVRLRAADGSTRLYVALVTPLAGAEHPAFAFSLSPAEPALNGTDRALELEMHVRRIAAEVAATGVLTELTGTPAATSVPAMTGLTSRELEIVTRLLSGERVPMIATGMFLSQSTVRNHLTSVYRKLGVHSQQELIAMLRDVGAARDGTRSA